MDAILFKLPPVNTKVNMKMCLKHNGNFLYQGPMKVLSAGDIRCLAYKKFNLIELIYLGALTFGDFLFIRIIICYFPSLSLNPRRDNVAVCRQA